MHYRHRRALWLLPVRNLVICIVSIAVILFSVDFIFSDADNAKGYSASQRDLQDEENHHIQLMQIEQMDPLDFLAGLGSNKRHHDIFESVYKSLSDAQKEKYAAVGESRYPLISYMQQDDLYDEDTMHIVVLGDSFTWGEASVNRNEIYWRLLETDLRAQGYNVRITAAAMISANSFDEFRWLTQTDLIDDLKPDMVVFAYLFNDPEWFSGVDDPYSPGFIDPIRLRSSALLSATERVLPNLSSRMRNYILAEVMYTADGNYIDDGNISVPILKGENLKRIEHDFLAPLDAFAAQQSFPVILMPLTLYQGERLMQQLYAPLHTLCETYRNIRLYDTTHDFFHGFDAPKHRNNYAINCTNLHPGSSMSYYYAQFMESFLKNDFADLLGEPSPKTETPRFTINEALPASCLRSIRNVSDTILTCEIDYPAHGQSHLLGDLQVRDYLWLPLEKDCVMLSFAQPVDLSQIELTGDNVEGAELFYRSINEKLGYDDHTVKPFGVQNGTLWTDNVPDRVTTLLLHADVAGGQTASMTIKIDAAEREGA